MAVVRPAGGGDCGQHLALLGHKMIGHMMIQRTEFLSDLLREGIAAGRVHLALLGHEIIQNEDR